MRAESAGTWVLILSLGIVGSAAAQSAETTPPEATAESPEPGDTGKTETAPDTVDAPAARSGASADEKPFAPVETTAIPLINLDVRDAALRNVLGQLADFGQINLVMPSDVVGKVTVRLRNVKWFDALQAVARSHGLGIRRRGNIVYIDRLDRLAAHQETRVKIREATEAAAPLVTRIFKLSYARAADLAPLIKTLLSPRGSVVVDTRTNSLIVTDVAVRVDRAAGRLAR